MRCHQAPFFFFFLAVAFHPALRRPFKYKTPQSSQVIVLQSTWKSGNFREALQYLRPNPFYMGIVRMLLEQQKVYLIYVFCMMS